VTLTETKLSKLKEAEAARRAVRRAVRDERLVSQVSGFIMTLAEALDDWVPFGIPSSVGRAILKKRIARRQRHEAA
jgi:hypothetical protein